MQFDDKYFVEFSFTKEQITKNLLNAEKDLNIAKQDKILEVKFNYAYTTHFAIPRLNIFFLVSENEQPW